MLFIVSRALTLGRRAALATVLGNEAGEYVQVIAVAVGIGVVVERSIVVFTVLKLGGAGRSSSTATPVTFPSNCWSSAWSSCSSPW